MEPSSAALFLLLLPVFGCTVEFDELFCFRFLCDVVFNEFAPAANLGIWGDVSVGVYYFILF